MRIIIKLLPLLILASLIFLIFLLLRNTWSIYKINEKIRKTEDQDDL